MEYQEVLDSHTSQTLLTTLLPCFDFSFQSVRGIISFEKFYLKKIGWDNSVGNEICISYANYSYSYEKHI